MVLFVRLNRSGRDEERSFTMDVLQYPEYIGLLCRLDSLLQEKEQVLLAIDGGSASGKSTLGTLLSERFDGTLFHMDDFFLRPEQRTPERYAEPGGNVDRERFLEEILIPLKQRKKTISFRKLDCKTFQLLPTVTVEPKRFAVIEGAYSMHPDLAEFYDLSVFLAVPPELQARRLLLRNGPEGAAVFHERWTPLEQKYFDALCPAERCDLVINVPDRDLG